MTRTAGPKVVRPWIVALLSFVTLGLYFLRWYYRVNREMRELGDACGDAPLAATRPVWSLVAVVVGRFLLVPAIVSYVRFGKRIQRCERLAGRGAHGAGGIVAMLVVVLLATDLASGARLTGAENLGVLLAIGAARAAVIASAQARLNDLVAHHAAE